MVETRDARNDYDIVIIGGGMVGASMACALLPAIERHGLRVSVIESFPVPQGKTKPRYQPSFDARSTALSYNSYRIFEKLGVWRALAQQVTPIRRIHVSDRGRFGSVRLNAQDHGIEALGYVIENAWLGRSLFAHLNKRGKTQYISPASVEAITPRQGGVAVTLVQAGKRQSLKAGLAVIADGGRSSLCEQLQIALEQRSYNQHAVIANVTSETPHENVAFERFTPDGPLALLPLAEPGAPVQNRFSMVYTERSEGVEQLMAQRDEDFLACLQARFGYRLGRFLQIGKRECYPLTQSRAKEQVRPGIVVIGNAAHTLHPVAGQGFNLALRGVDLLSKTLHDAVSQGQSIGSLEVLGGYLERQQRDQNKMMVGTHQALQLFTNNDLLLGLVRDVGKVALDLSLPAKKLFSQHAMGLGDRLPQV